MTLNRMIPNESCDGCFASLALRNGQNQGLQLEVGRLNVSIVQPQKH